MSDNGAPASPPMRRGRGAGIRGERQATELDRHIGTWARHHREAAGLSLAALAERLTARTPQAPWGETRIRRIEQGVMQARYNDVHLLLDELGVPLTLFYRETGIVTLPDTAEEAILSDHHLDARARSRLAAAYRVLRGVDDDA